MKAGNIVLFVLGLIAACFIAGAISAYYEQWQRDKERAKQRIRHATETKITNDNDKHQGAD